MTISIPRCEHGNILLCCPNDACEAKNAYLGEQRTALDAWDQRMTDEARRIMDLVLADSEPPCPRCEGSGQVTMHPDALHRYAIRDVYGEPWGDRETGPCPDCTGDET